MLEADDDYAVALLRRLDAEPGSPSRVDLGRAIAEARRRKARRVVRLGGAAAVTAVAVAGLPVALHAVRPADPAVGRPVVGTTPTAAPTTAAAPSSPAVAPAATVPPPTSCAVQRLSIPGGDPMSLVTGADPTGRFIVGRSYPSGHKGTYPVLVWDNGRARRVAIPGNDQSLNDVTSTGVAVGSGWGDGGPVPYVYRGGKVSRLPGVKAGRALAINEAGRIVGSRDAGRQVPVAWPSATTPPVELPLPGPEWAGEAVDVDADGTTIGVVLEPGRGGERGYLWLADGTGRLLPNPTLAGEVSDWFRPQSIRDGWVTGVAARRSSDGREVSASVRMRAPTGEFVDFPPSSVWPQTGNGQGWVAGSTDDGRAALLTDAGPLLLPDFNNHKLSTANIAWAMSDDGRTVAGQGDNAKGDPQAVVWRCR